MMTERAMSLHVGLNRVDPVHYAGWPGVLQACENDARDMAAIAEHQGFEPAVLLTRAATYEAVLGAIRRAAGLLHREDSFLLTFAGHGAQLPGSDPSEDDGLDETVVLFDRMLRDDELGTALRTFRPGVRLVVVSDSCHSGTVVRDRLDAAEPFDGPRFMPQECSSKRSPAIQSCTHVDSGHEILVPMFCCCLPRRTMKLRRTGPGTGFSPAC
jgi:hypothetical protein